MMGFYLILLKPRLHKWFGYQVTVVSKVDSKNLCPKGMISRGKMCQQLDSSQQLFICKSSALPPEHCLLWFRNSAQTSFLYVFAFNSLCRANGSTHELAVTDLE